jgi:anti-anti-sigma factor
VTADEASCFRQAKTVAIARIRCRELTPDIGEELRRGLLETEDPPQADNILLDLSGVRLLDATGLGVLAAFQKRVKESGRRLALAGLSRPCLHAMKAAGLEEAFDLYPSVARAVEGLSLRVFAQCVLETMTVVRFVCPDPAYEEGGGDRHRHGCL